MDAAITLTETNWFANVGQPMPSSFSGTGLVPNWETAIESCSDSIWEHVSTEARNDLTEHLNIACKEEFQKWNEVINLAKRELAEPWSQLAAKLDADGLPKIVADCVEWDTMHAFAVEYYRRWNPPLFFSNLLEVYSLGHFPCGWSGSWPAGEMRVF